MKENKHMPSEGYYGPEQGEGKKNPTTAHKEFFLGPLRR